MFVNKCELMLFDSHQGTELCKWQSIEPINRRFGNIIQGFEEMITCDLAAHQSP